jgi:hypothetical protein
MGERTSPTEEKKKTNKKTQKNMHTVGKTDSTTKGFYT